jgi:hypothetical protein
MYIHLLVWGEGITLVGKGVEFRNGDSAAVATLRKCYALRLQRDVCNICFQFMNKVKKPVQGIYKAYSK